MTEIEAPHGKTARHLDKIEVKWLHEQAAQVLEYEGELDEKALRQAFSILASRYPILRASVRQDNDRYLMEEAPDGALPVVICFGAVRDARRILHAIPGPDHGLARLTLLKEPGGGLIALHTYLFAVDGQSWVAIFSELMSLYTDLVAGRHVEEHFRTGLPASPTEVLARLGKTPDYEATPSPVAPGVQADARLSQAETVTLRELAHRLGTTVYALICGAVLHSQRAESDIEGEVDMLCLSAVDMRNRLSRSVGKTETMRFIGWHRADVRVGAHTDPVETGLAVKRQLDAAISEDDLPLLRPPLDLSGRLEPRLAKVLSTNVGLLPPLTHPVDLTVKNWKRIYTTASLAFPWHGFWTVLDELNIISVFPADAFSQDEADRINGRIRDHLRELAARCTAA